MDEQKHKKAIRAWTMYDWGNSAFATTMMAAVFPIFYTSVATAGLAPNMATAYWGYTTAIGALIAALISPILGAMADFRGSKKRFMTIFMIIRTATALLFFIRTGDWLLAFVLHLCISVSPPGLLRRVASACRHRTRSTSLFAVTPWIHRRRHSPGDQWP